MNCVANGKVKVKAKGNIKNGNLPLFRRGEMMMVRETITTAQLPRAAYESTSLDEKRAPTAGCRGSRSPQRDKTNWAGARRGTNYARLITLPSNPLGV